MLVSLLTLAIAWLAPGVPPDWKELAPDPKAKAHEPHVWTTRNELRYAWWLPEGYDPAAKRNLTVILHGTGLDHRWGPANNPPGVFRPDDVVISLDGPTPNGKSRLFLGEAKDATAFHECLEEWRGAFAIDRVFLYGHSQGSFFATYYAGEHPKDVAGLVAHASGVWSWTQFDKRLKDVAISFLHGTLDPVVPYGQSVGARDHADKLGLDLVHLRRLDRYNHWPNAVRATEELDWCEAMTTGDPERALVLAVRSLTPKGPDEYQWTTSVPFSGTRRILSRFEAGSPRAFADATDAQRGRAKKLADAIEAHAADHVAALAKALPKKLALDGGPWLGDLVPAREDLRGLAAMEALAKKLDYDALAKRHAQAADKILAAWYSSKPPAAIYTAIVSGLPDAFLFEGFPSELAERTEEWHAKAKELGLKKPVLADHEHFESWKKGWSDGIRAREKAWKAWRAPEKR